MLFFLMYQENAFIEVELNPFEIFTTGWLTEGRSRHRCDPIVKLMRKYSTTFSFPYRENILYNFKETGVFFIMKHRPMFV